MSESPGFFADGPNQQIEQRILDVDGTRLVISAYHSRAARHRTETSRLRNSWPPSKSADCQTVIDHEPETPRKWPIRLVAAGIAAAAAVDRDRRRGQRQGQAHILRGRIGDPLVDIRSRLVNHGDFELFRMNSDTESYWRLTTLPEFDGRTFKLPSRSLDRVDDAGVGAQGRTIHERSRSWR